MVCDEPESAKRRKKTWRSRSGFWSRVDADSFSWWRGGVLAVHNRNHGTEQRASRKRRRACPNFGARLMRVKKTLHPRRGSRAPGPCAGGGTIKGWGRPLLFFILTLMAQPSSRTTGCGPWRPLIARRPCPQGGSAVCTGFGSCTVSIFPCPASALGLGRPYFLLLTRTNPNPDK